MTTEAIRQFVADYINQSNACTAWPYAYVVQQEVRYAVPPGHGEKAYYNVPDCRPMNEDEIEEHNATYPDNVLDIDAMEHLGDEKREWQDVQWFYTRRAAEQYIVADGHNLGPTRLYVRHWRRNSEAELMLRTMFTAAGEDYDTYKR